MVGKIKYLYMNKNLETVLSILKNEVDGNVSSALQKMTADYSMTWMYKGKDGLFPSSKPDFASEMKDVYRTKGRKYEIKNIAEGEDVVMVELIESYPDPEAGKLHQTPLVLILEMKDGKIRAGRHYCDPRLSHEEIPPADLERAFQVTPTVKIVE